MTQPLTITSGGRTYALSPLGFNETARLEAALGATLPMITKQAKAGSVSAIRGVLWAALLREQPTFTLEDTGRLLDAMGGLDGLASTFAALTPATAPARSAPAPATRVRRRR